MSSSTIIDFRSSHLLLNPNFDGYKLSLDPVPILKTELNASPRRMFTSDEQYTFLHAKLFSLHNHLIHDPWLEYSCYFIDENWTIQNVRYDTTSGKLSLVKAVHKVSKPNTGRGDYNASLTFVSEKFCVFADGCDGLKVFNTGDRYRIEEWKTIFSDTIFENPIPFVVQDARWEIINNVHQIQCLLLSIQQNNDKEDEKFEAVLDWVAIKRDAQTNSWTKSQLRQLKGKTLPEYCVLEPKCNGILMSADRKFEFSFDNEHPIETPKDEASKEETNAQNDQDGTKPQLNWTQSNEDVTIHFNIPLETNKQDIKVICDGAILQVRHKNEALLNAELLQGVDKDLTTWNLGNEWLEVVLIKQVQSFTWPSLLKDIVILPSEMPLQTIRELSLPPSNLRTEMEDCDFGDIDMDKEHSFVRMDAISHQTTHKANLGSNNPVLFTLSLRAGSPLAFALRNDVDACVWLPYVQSNAENDVTLNIKHEGTLNAFGYIQASKQQKKFMKCSPDMNYAIICEPHRHIFVYKSTYATAAGLKNRNSSTKISIGQQKLITMDDSDEVLGIVCQTETTILLTQKHVLCLQINS